MTYFPPFELVKQYVSITTVKGDVRISASYDDFLAMLKLMLATVAVDEAWYLRAYDDISHAVRTGDVESAKKHFVSDGYFEGRLPGRVTVDSDWYLSQYPDVAESVRRGDFTSAQAHFDQDGYREGRLPFRT